MPLIANGANIFLHRDLFFHAIVCEIGVYEGLWNNLSLDQRTDFCNVNSGLLHSISGICNAFT